MAVRSVEAKLILSGEDRASRVIKEVAQATGAAAKAMADLGKARAGSAEVEKLTRALDGQKRVMREVEEVRRISAARASSDMSHRLAISRAQEVTKSLDAARKAQKALDDARKAGKPVDTAKIADAAREVARWTEQNRTAQRVVRETAGAVRVQTDALKRAKEAAGLLAVPVMNLTRHQEHLKKSIDQTTEAIKRQEKAEKEAEAAHLRGEAGRLRRLADEERRAERSQVRREAIKTLASGAGIVAAHRGKEIGLDAVRAVKTFDEAVRYQHVAGGISEAKQRDVMIPSAMKIAQETRFSNTDIVEAQTRVAQSLPMKDADVKADVAASITEQARHYAVIMKSDMTGAAEAIRSFLQTTQKDISTADKAVKEASRATNLVVAMSKLGGLSDEDAQQYIKYAFPTATAAGLSDTTVAALGSVGRRGGLRGDELGVFMRSSASKLVAPTKKGLDALSSAGIDYNRFTTMPGGLSTGTMEGFFKRRFGKSFDQDQRDQLDDLLQDSEVVGDRETFVSRLSGILSQSFDKKKNGEISAQDAGNIAKMLGDFHKLSVESVDAEGLLAEILKNPKMTLALKNAFFTDKHGGKATIVGAQFDQLLSDREAIIKATQDPTFSSEKSAYMIAGVSGSLENLAGSWENAVLRIGVANEGLIKKVSDQASGVLDKFAQLDTRSQQAIAIGGGIAATAGGAYGAYRLAKGVLGFGKLDGSAIKLDGSAAALTRSAVALEVAAGKLGAGGAVPDAVDKGGKAAGAAAGAAGVVARWAPTVGGLAIAGAGVIASGHGNAVAERQVMGGLERRKAEREGKDLPFLQQDLGKLQGELADIEKRAAEIGDDADKAPVLMALRNRKTAVETSLRDIEAKIATRTRSALDTGLDALSGIAGPAGQKIGSQAGAGIAEGVKAEAPKVIDQGRGLFDALKDLFGQGIAIPMRFAPDGAGGGGGSSGGSASGGLISASYGGQPTGGVSSGFPAISGSGSGSHDAPIGTGSGGSSWGVRAAGGEASPRVASLGAPGARAGVEGAQGIAKSGTANVAGLDGSFAGKLRDFARDAPDGISVFSAYRSPAHQARLFAQAVRKYGSVAAARKWVAPPGGSMHNRGLAADLRFASPAARAWAHANAAKYGLHFPMGHEPWHIEPLGARGRGAVAAPRQMPGPAPKRIPEAPAGGFGGGTSMMRAADRMNDAAERFERARLNTTHTIELTGTGREQAKVRGMKAVGEGPVMANLGVSMPQTRSV